VKEIKETTTKTRRGRAKKSAVAAEEIATNNDLVEDVAEIVTAPEEVAEVVSTDAVEEVSSPDTETPESTEETK
jgi:hypothetical protein